MAGRSGSAILTQLQTLLPLYFRLIRTEFPNAAWYQNADRVEKNHNRVGIFKIVSEIVSELLGHVGKKIRPQGGPPVTGQFFSLPFGSLGLELCLHFDPRNYSFFFHSPWRWEKSCRNLKTPTKNIYSLNSSRTITSVHIWTEWSPVAVSGVVNESHGFRNAQTKGKSLIPIYASSESESEAETNDSILDLTWYMYAHTCNHFFF